MLQEEENKSDRFKPLSMDGTVEELTFSLFQGGDCVQNQVAYHPAPQHDLQYVFVRLKWRNQTMK